MTATDPTTPQPAGGIIRDPATATRPPWVVRDDASRRWEWAAAYRRGATAVRALAGTVANPDTCADHLDALAGAIERGDLTPWADTPEPSTPPATAGVETLHDNEWLSLRVVRKPEAGVNGYVYSHESRCQGRIVAVLPYRIVADRVEYLVKSEMTPCWGFDQVLSAITGGYEGGDIEDDAVREMLEETGYTITRDELIPLGESFASKSADTLYSLFSVNLTGREQGEAIGDGSRVEAESAAVWLTDPELAKVRDPQVAVMHMRLWRQGTPATQRPAAPDPHPDTPDDAQAGTGVLGRALIDVDDDPWPLSDRAWAERHHGPVREVLLVTPDAWQRYERLAEAAQQARAAMYGDTSTIPDALGALAVAVDALGGGQPAGTGPGYGLHRPFTTDATCVHDEHLGSSNCHGDVQVEVCENCGDDWPCEIAAAYQAGLACRAEPAPEPAGGPGWVRRSALDKAAGRFLEVVAERDAARAELAEVTADRDRLRVGSAEAARSAYDSAAYAERGWTEVDRLRAEAKRERARAEFAEAGRNATGTKLGEVSIELEEVTAERDRLREKVEGRTRQLDRTGTELAEARAELATARATLARFAGSDDMVRAELARAIEERDLAIAHDRQPYPTADAYETATAALERAKRERDQLRAELATARRDAAADALDEHAHHMREQASKSSGDSHRRGLLRAAYAAEQRAAEIRDDQRPVPGSPDPDGVGDDA